MKQLLLILNPVSGMKKASRALAEIIDVFNRAQYDTHVYATACQGDAAKAVQQFGAQMDLIVCAGGDGTLNETVTGLLQAGLTIPLGYIPAGSTNDFASSLHLSTNVVKAAKQIVSGTPHAYDVGQFGDRYFAYVASFGAFTKASYSTPQNVKNALGHLAYILEGIQELSSLRKAHIRINLDNEVLEDDYLFGAICNSTSVGGILTLDPSLVDMGDGQFELLLLRAPRDIMELHECVVALQTQKYNCRMITFRSTNSLSVTATPAIPWSLDGEKADKTENIRIENLHQKIRLMH